MLLRLLLRQSNACELRVDEDRVGHHAVGDGRVTSLDQVRAQHAEIVVGDVREGGPALHISDGIHPASRRLQAIVHDDVARCIALDAGSLEVQGFGVPHASGGDQEVRAAQGLRAIVGLEDQLDVPAAQGDSLWADADAEPNAVAPQNLAQLCAYVLILAGCQARSLLDDRDLRTEPPEHLPELQPDEPTAQHHQVGRIRIQLHDRRGIEIRHVGEPA